MNWINQFYELFYPLDINKRDKNKAQQLKRKNWPVSLFKYRAVDDYSFKNLEEGTIWLSEPSDFNDPFDSYFDWNIIEIFDDLLVWGDRQTAEIYINSQYPHLSRPAKRQKIKEFMRDKPLMRQKLMNMQQELKQKNQENLDRYRKDAKIGSFSERLDSLPMWAHYANNHKGFCLEYDLHSMPDIISDNFYPILYTNERPKFTSLIKKVLHGFDQVNPDHMLIAPFIKSIDWNYEKEWRYILDNPATKGGMVLNIGPPKTVYLGNKIKEEDAKKISKLCKDKHINLAHMVLSQTRFGMIPVYSNQTKFRNS